MRAKGIKMDRKCLGCGKILKGKQVKDYCKRCVRISLSNKALLLEAITSFDNEFIIKEVLLLGEDKGIRRIILE